MRARRLPGGWSWLFCPFHGRPRGVPQVECLGEIYRARLRAPLTPRADQVSDSHRRPSLRSSGWFCRGAVLIVLDVMGKWSLIDVYVLVMTMMAFRLQVSGLARIWP